MSTRNPYPSIRSEADRLGSGVLLIGVGNENRGDDAAGLIAVRTFRKMAPQGVTLLEHGGEATALMDVWEREEAVILVDAVVSGRPAGSILRWEVKGRIPDFRSGKSTHDFGVSEAIRLAESLHRLPSQLVIYGIEAYAFHPGAALSGEISAAVDYMQTLLRNEIQSLLGSSGYGPDESDLPVWSNCLPSDDMI